MAHKLRILCLHGFTSNGSVHAHQVRNITQRLPSDYEFLFPDGPHVVDMPETDDSDNIAWQDYVASHSTSGHRAWWFARDGNWQNKETGGFFGLEESLTFIGDLIKSSGPVHAIWGFSQGACFAAMLMALLSSNHPMRKYLPVPDSEAPMAGVFFSGFKSRFEQYAGIYRPGIQVSTLHVIGANDLYIRKKIRRGLHSF
ncbi:hypothetical protein LTR67_009059 [Exophiala xenobiotica]